MVGISVSMAQSFWHANTQPHRRSEEQSCPKQRMHISILKPDVRVGRLTCAAGNIRLKLVLTSKVFDRDLFEYISYSRVGDTPKNLEVHAS